MKKFVPIMIGLAIGITVSAGMIVDHKNRVAYGADSVNWWNNFVATADGDLFDWQDVFTPFGPSEKGKNLYNLVYKKLTRQSGKDALQQVAKNNGLTIDEARAAINGSLLPILNNPKYSGTLTQSDAAKIMANLQDNFGDLSELYQIQQEVDVSIAPGEMFANGDLSDSGFDLVHDLSLIEEILFLEKSPQTIGGVFKDSYGSPYNPTEDDKTLANYVPNELSTAVLPLEDGASDDGASEKNERTGDENSNNLQNSDTVRVISIGDKKISAEILSSDVCAPTTNLAEALDATGEESDDGGVVGDNRDGAGGDPDGAGGNASGVGGNPDATGYSSVYPGDNRDQKNPPGKPKAATPDDWTKQWCAGYQEPGVFAGIGASGFKSLGGVSSNYVYGGNAAANYTSAAVTANLGVCFDIKLIPKRVSTFLPGDACILCEVQKINEYLDQTLSHTLVPNKATGNQMESAKCKNSGTLLNLQFITIWNPVPTPINDKLIFGKNIYEEWNKFVTRYQPYMVSKPGMNFEIEDRPDLTDNFNIQLQQELVTGSITQSKLFNDLNRIRARATAEASLSLKSAEIGDEVADTMVYSRNVLQEIKQMNALFENFKDTFEKTNKEALKPIVNKPNVK